MLSIYDQKESSEPILPLWGHENLLGFPKRHLDFWPTSHCLSTQSRGIHSTKTLWREEVLHFLQNDPLWCSRKHIMYHVVTIFSCCMSLLLWVRIIISWELGHEACSWNRWDFWNVFCSPLNVVYGNRSIFLSRVFHVLAVLVEEMFFSEKLAGREKLDSYQSSTKANVFARQN